MSAEPMTPDLAMTRQRRSLEERVADAWRDLILIHATCVAADTGDGALLADDDELFDVIAHAAKRAVDAINPLRGAPFLGGRPP